MERKIRTSPFVLNDSEDLNITKDWWWVFVSVLSRIFSIMNLRFIFSVVHNLLAGFGDPTCLTKALGSSPKNLRSRIWNFTLVRFVSLPVFCCCFLLHVDACVWGFVSSLWLCAYHRWMHVFDTMSKCVLSQTLENKLSLGWGGYCNL
jgi:hypothetical protein